MTNLTTPIKTSKIPEITDQILSGKLLKRCNFFPNIFPILKKTSWKMDINTGKRKELTPIILPKAPMQKQSKERANPKNKASLLSIEWEESKSEEVGFLIILIVIPKNSIKKL